jgi:hypothetical protein
VIQEGDIHSETAERIARIIEPIAWPAFQEEAMAQTTDNPKTVLYIALMLGAIPVLVALVFVIVAIVPGLAF